jgi:hypothetical protein
MRSIGGRQVEGFQNDEVVIHVIRRSRGAGVVAEILDGHRPALWVSDLYSAQQGHAEDWQICLAHYADLFVMPTSAWESAPVAVIAAMGSA